MQRAYNRLQRRSIQSSITRFLSILGIVAIGTGFLAGLLASAPDMKRTVSEYYRQASMMDADVKGTLGITQEDVDVLRALPEVETVMPAYVTDVIMNCSDGTGYVCRLYGVPLKQRGTDAFLNDFSLIQGRLPETPAEAVVININKFSNTFSPGQTFTVSPQNVDYEDRADTYAQETYTVVGVANTPHYMTVETEPSTVGSGRVEAVLYTFEECYSLDVYTDAFLTLKEAKALSAFSGPYEDLLEDTGDELEALGEKRSVIRYDQVKTEAQDKIDDAWDDYYEAKADAESDLADARAKLDDAQQELADAKDDLTTGQKKYDYAHYQFYKQKNAFEKEINAKRSELKQALAAGLITGDIYNAQMGAIDGAYDDGIAEFNKQHKKLEKAKTELADGAQDIADAEVKLSDAEVEYADAEQTLADELEKGENKINDAQQELDDLDAPEWVIQTRADTVGYISYESNADKINAIARVFPIFLFLVAALVSLTTMTRMVEEERTQIGTLKALGYTDRDILGYYVRYSLFASVLGSAMGMVLGFWLLPSVISRAYEMMYTIPPILTEFRWDMALVIAPAAILCTTTATVWACLSTLQEKPAALMLPRAPKAGKRIFLERIPFLWNPLKFTTKVTCRNIFRYKKRLYMTVIGIAGCTALLLTGFGLRDSINDIVDKQFGELYRYGMTILLSGGDALTESPALAHYLENSGEVSSYAPIHLESGTVYAQDGRHEETNIYVPAQTDQLKKHIVLRERKTGADIPFAQDSAVFTEKLCEQLNLAVGSQVTIENNDGEKATLTVTGIGENYVTSYVFISEQTYTRLFGSAPEYDRIIADAADATRAGEDAVSAKLLAFDDVTLVQFNSSIRSSFDNLIGNINYIVYVLIASAGALAIIVVYNLTNINISERKKELATIKVLGFYEGEVAMYIYRETTVLSILGTLAGFGFGIWLHSFVVSTAEVDAVMFGRVIYPASYALAAAVTLLFTLLVELIMLPKIRSIDMVESMKAND